MQIRRQSTDDEMDDEYALDAALPSGLWDPDLGVVSGGVDHSVEEVSADTASEADPATLAAEPGQGGGDTA